MRSTKQVIERTAIPAKLVRAVIRQLGGKYEVTTSSTFQDITNHGIDGGFHGFIYTRDTVAFFKHNRKEIVELVQRQASDFGEPVIDMVASFNCLGGRDLKNRQFGNDGFPVTTREAVRVSDRKHILGEYADSIARCLYGHLSDHTLIEEDFIVANALAWFAAEEVARAFCDE